MKQHIFTITNSPVSHGCPLDCRTRRFSVQKENHKSDVSYANVNLVRGYMAEGIRDLNMKISSPVVKVNTEYKVYDFNGIVGSVGGSLGLFIGFSFFDFLLYILDKSIVPYFETA